jgi:hypothetical protein
MKIFPRKFVRQLYRTNNLEEILSILSPWITLVAKPQSPFMRQVASYLLRKQGGSYAPRFFKEIVASEIIRLTESEDLTSILNLSIIESFAEFRPGKGTDLVNWLSWKIPYHCSKLVTYRAIHSIEPCERSAIPKNLTEFEGIEATKRKVAIICSDLGLKRQNRYYYLKELRNESDAKDSL